MWFVCNFQCLLWGDAVKLVGKIIKYSSKWSAFKFIEFECFEPFFQGIRHGVNVWYLLSSILWLCVCVIVGERVCVCVFVSHITTREIGIVHSRCVWLLLLVFVAGTKGQVYIEFRLMRHLNALCVRYDRKYCSHQNGSPKIAVMITFDDDLAWNSVCLSVLSVVYFNRYHLTRNSLFKRHQLAGWVLE